MSAKGHRDRTESEVAEELHPLILEDGRTNGKAERFIQTLLREWAYQLPYVSSARRTAALTRYLRYYNHQRPHASLGRRAPWTRFQEAA